MSLEKYCGKIQTAWKHKEKSNTSDFIIESSQHIEQRQQYYETQMMGWLGYYCRLKTVVIPLHETTSVGITLKYFCVCAHGHRGGRNII